MTLPNKPRFAARSLVFAAFVLGCGEGTAPENPVPAVTALVPGTIEQWSQALVVSVVGTGFVETSGVRVNSNDRETEYVGSTELRATLLESDFTAAGTIAVSVINPTPGGGTSNSVSLVVAEGANPIPTISEVSPEFALMGSDVTDITVMGTGFLTGSTFNVGPDYTERESSYVSATEIHGTLTAEDLTRSRTLYFLVYNPDPGGGPSNIVEFEVRTPTPVITSLGETQTTAGAPRHTLQVNGSGFIDSSQVSVNGAPRQTQRTAPGILEVTLVEDDLATAGSLSITVTNPAPGGGTSNSFQFSVVVGSPDIHLLPSRGATAGGVGFTLYVHGSGFVNGSVVRWEGSDRSTQYLGGTRLSASVSAADVAQAGVKQVTVVNPVQGGSSSASTTMTVRLPGATTSTSQTLTLSGEDIAYDSTRGLLYVSVGSSAPSNANSIVAIDPTTGTIVDSEFVGSAPAKLAISDGDQFLYVALNGANAVRRIDLASFTPGIQWSIGTGQIAGDMAVVPSLPTAVAVSRQVPGTSPPLQGVTVYDDGVARAISSPGHTGANRLEALESTSILYGYNNSHTGFEFFRIGIEADGARHLSATGGLIRGFSTNIVGSAGRIYGTDGSIVDAEQRTKVGTFPTAAVVLAVDPELGRAYLQLGPEIHVCDLNNYVLLGTVSVPSPNSGSPTLVRWGDDGIAYIDDAHLFIVRSPIFGS